VLHYILQHAVISISTLYVVAILSFLLMTEPIEGHTLKLMCAAFNQKITKE
jgi:hypothetical protein